MRRPEEEAWGESRVALRNEVKHGRNEVKHGQSGMYRNPQRPILSETGNTQIQVILSLDYTKSSRKLGVCQLPSISTTTSTSCAASRSRIRPKLDTRRTSPHASASTIPVSPTTPANIVHGPWKRLSVLNHAPPPSPSNATSNPTPARHSPANGSCPDAPFFESGNTLPFYNSAH